MIGLPSVLPLLAIWLAIACRCVVAVRDLCHDQVLADRQPEFSSSSRRFLPLRVSPHDQGETVEFTTDDGLAASAAATCGRGRYEQAGVIVYCHEYLSDRWSYHPYLDHLRDLGFDIFTFDFRNHGESESEPGYEPMQWTSDREVRDLRAALGVSAVAARSRSGGFRPLRREPRRNDGPDRGRVESRRLGRRDRRSVSDPGNDGPLHHALVRDLRPQSDRPKPSADVDLRRRGRGPAGGTRSVA